MHDGPSLAHGRCMSSVHLMRALAESHRGAEGQRCAPQQVPPSGLVHDCRWRHDAASRGDRRELPPWRGARQAQHGSPTLRTFALLPVRLYPLKCGSQGVRRGKDRRGRNAVCRQNHHRVQCKITLGSEISAERSGWQPLRHQKLKLLVALTPQTCRGQGLTGRVQCSTNDCDGLSHHLVTCATVPIH